MASVTETGHAKNIAQFDDLIRRCQLFGTAYSPSDTTIQIMALQAKSTAAKNALANAKNAKSLLDIATNEREILFDRLRPLATRVVNVFEASRVSQQALDDIKTVNRKLSGARAPGKKNKRLAAPPTTVPDAGTEGLPGKHSVSQQGRVALMDHFEQMISIVSNEPLYNPSDTDLQVAGLNNYLNDLRTAHENAENALAAYDNALDARNIELYHKITGLVTLGKIARTHIKGHFGPKSDEYDQVRGLQFVVI